MRDDLIQNMYKVTVVTPRQWSTRFTVEALKQKLSNAEHDKERAEKKK